MLQLKKSLDLSGYTIIIPSICVGNAAQLACDLLISSKQLQRVGIFHHPALIPVCGPSPYQHEPQEIAAACELYESAQDKLFVIQFRAPFISIHMKSFNNEIIKLVEKAQRVIILSGSFGFEKRIIQDSPYAYKVCSNFKKLYGKELNTVKWKEFKGEQIYGSGNASQLFAALEQNNIPVMLLFRYLLEGDNSTDAALMLNELNEICGGFLQLSKGEGSNDLQLTVPISWKLLFGNGVPELIF